ncbi:tetratricopeptide repeat protein [Polaromonas sp. JS666]|uniref:tetratricopeptide repeat protein n=1 Tax=Polaromonas sp. (strain JS666 / ATCC BAA-500) TaxID=296591 RepID=UPI00088FEE48|nr:tetratricopeptide repeat protein [Polaromonas sp. JS666]SDM55044.1 Tetratricopeptide repeat-containing protein [Polaromonas sp. JS666]
MRKTSQPQTAWLAVAALAFSVFAAFTGFPAFSQTAAPNEPSQAIAAPNPEDAALGQQLMAAAQLLQLRQPERAITEHLDKIIAAYELRYKDEKFRPYTGRSRVEQLLYLVQAAASKQEPEQGAIIVPQIWSDAWYLKGYALIELRRPAEARSALEAALALAPRNAQYLGELGNWYLGQRNWPQALKIFEQAEAAAKAFSPPEVKNTELSRAWRGFGYVYVEQGRWDDAEKIYLQCLELDKNDRRAQNELNYVRSQRPSQRAPAATP